ncbi:hypothetical protein Lal_00001763 [Lupinus albus]|nr:hypothetical protein Lal_00001763 [Lupinus albus]
MKKPAQPHKLAMSSSVPRTWCWPEGSVAVTEAWWLIAPPPFMILKAGPLYKVITMAPETVTAVPINLATLWNFFMFTVSNLYTRFHSSYDGEVIGGLPENECHDKCNGWQYIYSGGCKRC